MAMQSLRWNLTGVLGTILIGIALAPTTALGESPDQDEVTTQDANEVIIHDADASDETGERAVHFAATFPAL